jgi:lipoprotein-anchoring transpeptidase ErfK/SrfK
VLVLAWGARPIKTLHASSGKSSTPTVFGHYRFYSKNAGYNARRMYFSNYFVGGYAIHGYADVPTYPASHGCIRIPIVNAIAVYRWIRLGTQIFVYR